MKTEQELKQLAIDIVAGKVFGSWCLKDPDDAMMVFMCIIFLSPEQRKEMEKEGVVHLYEYLDKANPRSVNGLPTFMSMQLLTKNELEILLPFVEQSKEQKEAFLTTK